MQSCLVTPGMCSRTAVGEEGVGRSSPKTFGRGNSQLVDAAESSCSESKVHACGSTWVTMHCAQEGKSIKMLCQWTK